MLLPEKLAMGSSIRSRFRVSEHHTSSTRRYTKNPDANEVSSMPLPSPLDLRVPRNLTATLQLIQRLVGREAVSYTHLDVYKRQVLQGARLAGARRDRWPAGHRPEPRLVRPRRAGAACPN